MTNLNDLLKHLLDSKIDFVIIGGFAGVIYGANQVTQDLDIALSLNKNQISQLREILKDLNPIHRMNPNFQPSFLEYPENLDDINNIYLETDWGILDILSEVPYIGDFERVNRDAQEVEIFNHKCKIISLDDLIEVKKRSGRAKDIALYHELLEIKKSNSN